MDPAGANKKAPKSAIHVFDANHRFIIACALFILAFLGLHEYAFSTQLVGAWSVFAIAIIGFAWVVILTKDPYEVRRDAKFQDTTVPLIFVITVSAAAMSLLAVVILLGASKHLSNFRFASHIVLSISAIALSWLLVHTLFSIHYARLYYIDAPKKKRESIEGGLLFPGDKMPDYLDFAYFSFVIGMTSQVSDVQISSKVMRRMATVHGLISFAFNTAILAMFVNIVASLI
jgi:uncharacterized membrane protein